MSAQVTPAAALDSDSDSFSSGSDDEFLTMREDGGNVDREALIRKKLLESFYGKAPETSSQDKDDQSGGDYSTDDDDDLDGGPAKSSHNGADPSSASDLDSTHFQPALHTSNHVLQKDVHLLLETEESLACQVRTLDSTMQTLVYENYSRFIEATDAVRSIGVNVDAHASGLGQLEESIQRVATTSRAVEVDVGQLRDQVVEKLRVKRLLQRLDTLLKLPTTLSQQIQSSKYRWATKSYLSVYSILSKHSTGFESLQKIETECQDIMTKMLVDVRHKLLHWSGSSQLFGHEDDLEESDPPDPPQSIVHIFECAGAPVLILQQDKDDHQFKPGLSVEECQEMALAACLRWLERVLDTHHIELQEHMFSQQQQQEQDQASPASPSSWLIPTNVLDSILEASTLYTMTFSSTDTNDEALADFVGAAFLAFLQHVRASLLDHALQASPVTTDAGFAEGTEEVDEKERYITTEKEEEAYEQIDGAMSLLLQSVRQLASGLTLQEVAVDDELASSLVEQTISLTEAMVRRRVDQKFVTLRQRVIDDCLAPFSRAAFQVEEQKDEEDNTSLLQVVQLASVALSDSLQLVDDTVRSILAATEDLSMTRVPSSSALEGSSHHSHTSSPDNSGMLIEAVEQSTRRFALWLAATMEELSGCEPSHPKIMVQVSAIAGKQKKTENDTASYATSDDDDDDAYTHDTNSVSVAESIRAFMQSNQEASSDPTNAVVEKALLSLLEEMASNFNDNKRLQSNMMLAVAETCRVAERSVMENILQSIGTHGGRGKNRKAKLFEVEGYNNNTGDTDNPISARFRLAASRILTSYAMNQGALAANLLCDTMADDILTKEREEEESSLEGPRTGTWQLLELIKSSCQDCADLFGGSKRAGPVPESLEDEYISLTLSSQQHKSGLAFDVERMFAEKIIIYPHPNDMTDFQRNAVVVLILKVALKACVESSRCMQFSLFGYRQLMADIEFLKYMLPHYVKDEVLADGSNTKTMLEALMTDVMSTARVQCSASSMLDDEQEEINYARSAIRIFISANSNVLFKRFVIQEDSN